MTTTSLAAACCVALGFLASAACAPSADDRAAPAAEPVGALDAPPAPGDRASEPIRPLPRLDDLGLDPERVALGHALFSDPRLSADGSLSCSSCHPVAAGGADGLARSMGIGRAPTAVNTPTVLNSAFNFRQFWDGRAETLEEQVDGPLMNPEEMGNTWQEALATLRADAPMVARFEAVYGRGPDEDSVRNALATYERALVTPDSPFDRWLRGDDKALAEVELRGYRRFKELGCVACHQGVNVGGNMFQRLGVMRDYFADRGDIVEADYGRFNVTGREVDRYRFKVPSLRGVANTAPYFHDGSAATLADAVEAMARYQLGRELDEQDVSSIVAFLGSLTAGVAPGLE